MKIPKHLVNKNIARKAKINKKKYNNHGRINKTKSDKSSNSIRN